MKTNNTKQRIDFNEELGTKGYLLYCYQMYKHLGVYEEKEILLLLEKEELGDNKILSYRVSNGRFNKVTYKVKLLIASNQSCIDLDVSLEYAQQNLLMFRKGLIKNVKDD